MAKRASEAWQWILLDLGTIGLILALSLSDHDAARALTATWSPFVLVIGLLLIGFVANEDGLFRVLGEILARSTKNTIVFYIGSALLVTIVTAVLNLDTAVAFLTPVLIFASRSRGSNETPLLYASLLLANAGSLFLPGSNLTNLIVLNHDRLSGLTFLSHTWLAAIASVVVTTAVLLVVERKSFSVPPIVVEKDRTTMGSLGIVAVLLGTVFILVFRTAAVEVLATGVAATGILALRRSASKEKLFELLGVRTLAGLFGVAVGLGTLGRVWSGPSSLLHHLNLWGVGFFAAATSIVFNNLPSAALLTAHAPAHPYGVLVGLNLGPNLCVTGSLAWLLWWRSARSVGATPSLRSASYRGILVTPLSMCAALAAISLTASH